MGSGVTPGLRLARYSFRRSATQPHYPGPMYSPDRAALILVDVQRGMDDPSWGPRNNPDCEANVARLLAHWRERGGTVVFVRHDSGEPGSPLRPDQPGNAFKSVISGDPDLLVTKDVNSAFLGTPALEPWLRERGIDAIVVAGIQTNMCCVPTGTVRISQRTSRSRARRHPCDARAPTRSGRSVPWMARRPSIGPTRTFGWWPESARMQQP